MFLDRAHQASRYYGTLLKDIKGGIFVDGHAPLAYYVSAYTLFRVEYFLRRKQIDSKYRPFKYHLLGVIRMQAGGFDMPAMSSNLFAKYCEQLKMHLWDEQKCIKSVTAACSILDEILAGDYNRDRAKDRTIQPRAKGIISA